MVAFERYVDTDGTISIGAGESVVTGAGTLFGSHDREASAIYAVQPSGALVLIGIVAAVDPRGQYDNLSLPLVAPYNGAPIANSPYLIVDGPAISSGTTQAAIFARYSAFLERNMGLTGSTSDDIDWSLVPNNSLFVDDVTRTIYQWRNGNLQPVNVIGAGQTPRGEWDSNTEYAQNDLVSLGGFLFISNESGNEGNQPVTSPEPQSDEWWTIFPAMPGPRGEKGPPGAGVTPTGAWNGARPYEPGESVSTSAGSSFVALAENTGVEPGVTAGWETNWQVLATAGGDGSDGRTIHTVSGAPASGFGNDGDYAIDPSTSTLYGPKASGVWPAGKSLIGSTGASVLAGTGAPSSGIGNVGDIYIDTSSGDLYEKGPSGWGPPIGNIEGPDGLAATVAVGDVTTVGPNVPAAVRNAGTANAAVLEFDIPRGQPGAAATVTVDSTVTLPAGSDAIVTNEGTSSAASFKFSIPRGDKGDTGNAATIAVGDVTTVGPTAPADVVNTGTANAAVLDFDIPKGGDGWSPVPANVTDGERRVQQVVDWVGGEGAKPTTGKYVGPTGFVDTLAEATDIRGQSGSGTGDMLVSVYDPQNINADVFNRANHTGTQTLSTISDAGSAAAANVADFATAAQGARADAALPAASAAPVATSGDYNDLTNLPAIPAAQVPADWNATTGVARILNKPTAFPPTAHTHNAGDINAGTLAIARIPTGTTASTVALGNHTHGAATTGAPGFMSAADKAKLDGIAAGATANTGTVTSVSLSLPTGLQVSGSPVTTSGTFTVSYAPGYQGYTAAEAGKLSGIEAGADVTDAANVAAAADDISVWRAATSGSGAISFDCLNGERLCWQHTATAATFINAPVNLPDGLTCYLEFDPAGQTITWGSAYRDDPPDVTVKSLIVIVRSGAQYIATLAHEAA